MSGHAFWIDQRTGHVSGLHQQDPGRKARCLRHCIPGRHPQLHRKRGTGPRSRSEVDSGATAETLPVRQLKKGLISSERSTIPRLRRLPPRHSNGR